MRKLTKVQRLACLMISSAFPGTPTGALELLHNITTIKKFLLAKAVRRSSRITVSGLWHAIPVGSFGKTKSHVDVCNEARRFLPELEFSRTSSRTHFEVLGLGLEGQVLGLGLEAPSPRKLACPRLEDSTIFWNVKILWSA